MSERVIVSVLNHSDFYKFINNKKGKTKMLFKKDKKTKKTTSTKKATKPSKAVKKAKKVVMPQRLKKRKI